MKCVWIVAAYFATMAASCAGSEASMLMCVEELFVPGHSPGSPIGGGADQVYEITFGIAADGRRKILRVLGDVPRESKFLEKVLSRTRFSKDCRGTELKMRIRYRSELDSKLDRSEFQTIRFRSPNEFVVTYKYRGGGSNVSIP